MEDNKTMEINPQMNVTYNPYDEVMAPRYEFGGYDISPEDMEELKRRHNYGKR